MKNLVYLMYKFFSSIKNQIILSGLGAVSECKHKEDCGLYWLRQTREQGWLKGSCRGIIRFLKCW